MTLNIGSCDAGRGFGYLSNENRTGDHQIRVSALRLRIGRGDPKPSQETGEERARVRPDFASTCDPVAPVRGTEPHFCTASGATILRSVCFHVRETRRGGQVYSGRPGNQSANKARATGTAGRYIRGKLPGRKLGHCRNGPFFKYFVFRLEGPKVTPMHTLK